MWNVILEEKEKSFINIVGSRQNSREGVDESAANSEEKKRATAFPLKFLKAGCQNIHLDQILRADFVKRLKQATLLIEISSFQS